MNLADIYANLSHQDLLKGKRGHIVLGYVVRQERRFFSKKDVFLLAYYNGESISTSIFSLLMAYSDLDEMYIRNMPKKNSGKLRERGQFVYRNSYNMGKAMVYIANVLDKKSSIKTAAYTLGPLEHYRDLPSAFERFRNRPVSK